MPALGNIPSTFRVAGGGYTTFHFNGQPLLYVDVLRETAPQPVARPQPVQPLDSPYPIEIAFPAALQAGTMDVQIREVWNAEVWAQLPTTSGTYPYSGAEDLLGVFKANLAAGTITCTKIITYPNNSGRRAIQYLNCVVTNVQVDETDAIDTMTLPKTITIMYTQRKAYNYSS